MPKSSTFKLIIDELVLLEPTEPSTLFIDPASPASFDTLLAAVISTLSEEDKTIIYNALEDIRELELSSPEVIEELRKKHVTLLENPLLFTTLMNGITIARHTLIKTYKDDPSKKSIDTLFDFLKETQSTLKLMDELLALYGPLSTEILSSPVYRNFTKIFYQDLHLILNNTSEALHNKSSEQNELLIDYFKDCLGAHHDRALLFVQHATSVQSPDDSPEPNSVCSEWLNVLNSFMAYAYLHKTKYYFAVGEDKEALATVDSFNTLIKGETLRKHRIIYKVISEKLSRLTNETQSNQKRKAYIEVRQLMINPLQAMADMGQKETSDHIKENLKQYLDTLKKTQHIDVNVLTTIKKSIVLLQLVVDVNNSLFELSTLTDLKQLTQEAQRILKKDTSNLFAGLIRAYMHIISEGIDKKIEWVQAAQQSSSLETKTEAPLSQKDTIRMLEAQVTQLEKENKRRQEEHAQSKNKKKRAEQQKKKELEALQETIKGLIQAKRDLEKPLAPSQEKSTREAETAIKALEAEITNLKAGNATLQAKVKSAPSLEKKPQDQKKLDSLKQQIEQSKAEIEASKAQAHTLEERLRVTETQNAQMRTQLESLQTQSRKQAEHAQVLARLEKTQKALDVVEATIERIEHQHLVNYKRFLRSATKITIHLTDAQILDMLPCRPSFDR